MFIRTLLFICIVTETVYGCVFPGTCTAPTQSRYSTISIGPSPGQQWNINGGFCGAFSVQQAALSAGAWISQDYVRKANAHFNGSKVMHGDSKVGYEVMPNNVRATAEGLKLDFEEWDYNQPAPQAEAYMKWIKSHLAKSNPVVWFPICKGDGHGCYSDTDHPTGACPRHGATDHVEVMYGLYSNHSLNETTVYDDDVIVHTSDQDLNPYYRRIRSLPDGLDMTGNCKDAQPGFGKNEMYPCFTKQ